MPERLHSHPRTRDQKWAYEWWYTLSPVNHKDTSQSQGVCEIVYVEEGGVRISQSVPYEAA